VEPVLLLPLAAFIALAAASVIILRRAGRLIANQREIQSFRSSVRDLNERIGMSLDGAAQRIDGVRRQQLSAEGLGDTVAATGDAITRYSDEARALKGPPEAAAIARDLVSDLDRAKRAIDMVEHGATILASVRRGSRELEAQTSIKRGYLNLIHAREAIARDAARAADLEPSRSPRGSWQPMGPELTDARDDASNHTM
jgi:hypothetical protein